MQVVVDLDFAPSSRPAAVWLAEELFPTEQSRCRCIIKAVVFKLSGTQVQTFVCIVIGVLTDGGATAFLAFGLCKRERLVFERLDRKVLAAHWSACRCGKFES